MTDVILVTGASGFLGQHVIRELHKYENATNIKEIRLVDRKPFKKFLDYDESVPMNFFEIDCTNEDELGTVMDGCTTVFHAAAKLYSFNIYPDDSAYWRDNYISTETVMDLMVKHSVQNLIYVSDAMANLPAGDHYGSTEITAMNGPKNDNYLLGIYGQTKFAAEKLVLEKNGTKMEDGDRLSCIIVRPTLMFGEGDSCLVPHAMDICRQFGSLWVVGCGNGGVFQLTYAGNTAAMLAQAWLLVKSSPEIYAGEVFYSADDFAPFQYYEFIKPFIEAAGYKLSPFRINYYVGMWGVWMMEKTLKILSYISSSQIGNQMPSCQMVRIIGAWGYGFCSRKGRLFLHFKPIYDQKIAMERTIAWWKKKIESKEEITVFGD